MSDNPESAARWQRTAALFDELVELDEATRLQRLDGLTAEQPDIVAELRRMLEADGRAAATLDQDWRAAMQLTSRIDNEELATFESPTDRSGESVDQYRLLRRVGRGGMGEVYLAERVGGDFAQRVALKLLRRGVDTEDVIRRFVQERSILARLEHPGIARLIDGGVAGEGLPYLVMEYVEGEQLTAFARSHDLDVEARLRLLIAVCEAVDFAHRRLVVHRDLKPSNVLVAEDGSVKLLDFGIAKLLDADADDQQLTGTGMRVLSPAYAAPEQFLGEPIGTGTDVYALGVLLFELLTGELPHQRNSRSLDVLAQAVTQERVEKPSTVLRRNSNIETARLARRIEGDLDTIVLTALQREPERRYASAAALAQDLRAYLDGRPIAAHPDTFGYRAGKFVRRNRFVVGSASAVLLALIAGFSIALWQTGVARQQATRADAQSRIAKLEAARAETQAAEARAQTARVRNVKDFMMSIFLQEDPLRRTTGAPMTLAQAFDATLLRVDKELAADPALQADLFDDFGEVEAGRGDLVAATKLIEKARDLAIKAHGPDHPAVAESLLNLGVLSGYRGEPLAGEEALDRAVAILEKHADTEPVSLSAALSGLVNVRRFQGRYDDAARLQAREIAILRGMAEPDRRRIAISLQNLGALLIDLNRFDEAEVKLKESLAMTEHDFGVESPNLINTLGHLESIAYGRGDFEHERELVERRLAVARKSLKGDHDWTADALGEAGYLDARDGDFEAGIARMHEAIAMHERLKDPEVFIVKRRLAAVLDRRGEHAAALEVANAAVAACIAAVPDSLMCQTTRANRAEILARTAPEAALAEADGALAVLAKLTHGPSDELAQAYEARAASLAGLGRVADARVALTEALRANEAVYGKNHPASLRTRARLENLR
ncbi:MAG: serine/threonine-protein kinase [Lysobacterales bacterium]